MAHEALGLDEGDAGASEAGGVGDSQGVEVRDAVRRLVLDLGGLEIDAVGVCPLTQRTHPDGSRAAWAAPPGTLAVMGHDDRHAFRPARVRPLRRGHNYPSEDMWDIVKPMWTRRGVSGPGCLYSFLDPVGWNVDFPSSWTAEFDFIGVIWDVCHGPTIRRAKRFKLDASGSISRDGAVTWGSDRLTPTGADGKPAGSPVPPSKSAPADAPSAVPEDWIVR